jgi:propionate CoA-transferase
VNFEGLRIITEEDLESLARFLDEKLSFIGKKVNVVVNYDNFELNQQVEAKFLKMVEYNTKKYFLTSTRYSSDPFYRQLLAKKFSSIHLEKTIFSSATSAIEKIQGV